MRGFADKELDSATACDPDFKSGADAMTRNELLYSSKKPAASILATVEFLVDADHHAHDKRRPFQREPDFGATNVNYCLAEMLAQAEETG